MKRYAKGAGLERLAKRELEEDGFAVIRSAGSKGPVDLIAVNYHAVRAIQIKARRFNENDLKKLADFPAPPRVQRELWTRRGRQWQIARVKRGEST